MSTRKAVSNPMQKRLFQEAGSACVVCDLAETNKLIIHHIEPYSEVQCHEFENLIVLCANCHRDADDGKISKRKLRTIKGSLGGPLKFPSGKSAPTTIVSGQQNIVATAGGVVNIDEVQLRSSRTRPSPPLLPGTIATDALRYNYLKYLASRYIEFRKWHSKTDGVDFKPMLIYVNFKRRFKCDMRHLPLTRFDDAVDYLQLQVANSKLGRIQQSKGRSVFQSFEDYVSENQ